MCCPFVSSFKLQNACLATHSGITTYVLCSLGLLCPAISTRLLRRYIVSVSNVDSVWALQCKVKGIVNQQDSGDYFGCCTTCLASGIMLPASFGGVNLMLVPLGTAMVSCPCLNHCNMDMFFESSKSSGLNQLQQAALLASALPGLGIVKTSCWATMSQSSNKLCHA